MSRLILVGATCMLFGALVGWLLGYQAGWMDKTTSQDRPDRVDDDESDASRPDGGS